jgi:hypothetical protein
MSSESAELFRTLLATFLRICEALDVRLTTMLAELEQRSIGKAR